MKPLRVTTACLTCLISYGCAAADGDRAILQLSQFDTLLTVGTSDAVEGHDLYHVVAATWSPEHGLVVADGGMGEVRVFGTDGRLLETLGRKGSGPGEFLSLTGAWLISDTILTYDTQLSRVSAWNVESGELLSETQLPRASRRLVGRFDDGSYLELRAIRHPVGQPGALRVDTAVYYRLLTDSESSAELGRAPVQHLATVRVPSNSVIETPLPLFPSGFFAAAGSTFVVGYSDGSPIQLRSLADTAVRDVSIANTPDEMTDEIKSNWQEPLLGTLPGARRDARRYLETLPYPTHLPAYDQLVMTKPEQVWIRRFPHPGSAVAEWIKVLPRTTAPALLMPVDARVMEIGPDYLVTLQPDAGGRPVVSVLSFESSEP